MKSRPPWPWERVKEPIKVNLYIDGKRVAEYVERWQLVR